MKCKYENPDLNFRCDEDAAIDSLCIFHHPEYWKKNSDEVRSKFFEKVENAIKTMRELRCIGYHLPEIDLSEKTFTSPVDFSYAIFLGKVNFSNVTFSEVEFKGTKFLGTTVFNKAEFSNGATFINVQFSSVHFNNAKFVGPTDFSGASFQEIYFNEVEFTDSAYFNNAEFKKGIFHEVKFHSEVNFNETHFDVCRFIKSRFINLAYFIGSNFSNIAEFKDTIFRSADFSDSEFKKLEFKRVEVSNTIKFSGAKFYSVMAMINSDIEEADFDTAKFYELVDIYSSFRRLNFTNAKFYGYALFHGASIHRRKQNNANDAKEIRHMIFFKATFEEYALFQNLKTILAEFQFTEFLDTVEFINVEFLTANFLRATFTKAKFIYIDFENGNFEGAKFKNIGVLDSKFRCANFIYAIFEGVTEFRGVTFQFANFSRTTFKDVAIFHAKETKEDCIILFSQSMFRNPEIVSFIDFPLSNISFLLTDVSHIKLFCDVSKIKDDGILSERLLKISSTNRTEKYDRKYVNEAIKSLSPYLGPENVLAEYRGIRKSFENNRTFVEASDLFIREMKLLRENLTKLERIAHIVYEKLSNYGESFVKPTSILLGFIFGIPAIISLKANPADLKEFYSIYASHLEKTSRIFFQLSVKNGYGIWEVPMRIISILLFGNIFIAFRRRLERK